MMIDRYQLVSRHNPQMKEFNSLSPLSVGNGEFAFTVDVTGLQTFHQLYDKGMPLCTQSNWGWHSYPTPKELRDQKVKLKYYDTFGRQVGYHTSPDGQEEIFDWLRINPHRFHLGEIGLEMYLSDGRPVEPKDLKGIDQTLDLWQGIITSRFFIENIPVTVTTACHPQQDAVLVAAESPLISMGRLSIRFAFPYASHKLTAADWKQPEAHKTYTTITNNSVQWLRILDETTYYCTAKFTDPVSVIQSDRHLFYCKPAGESNRIEFSALFSEKAPRSEVVSFAQGLAASSNYWPSFWLSGGAIQLAESKDPRALELERRIILSQYVTAIQCAGSLPPQETGLTCNSWYGKAHLEMHWWHGVHFALWGRTHLLEKSLWWYDAILPKAKEIAENQGYKGVRWPKMVGPKGIDTPSKVAPLLIWQQPHPIIYAELCYQNQPTKDTLERYKELVFETAEFMVSFAHYDQEQDRYVLGAPLIPAQENHRPMDTLNPTYELEYWDHALRIAQAWRKRLGMDENPEWADVINKLSSLPVQDGVYLAHEKCPTTFTEFNIDHPSMLCACGVLPGRKVDQQIMRNTLKLVMECWHWDRAWGWDFPVTAMAAARVGEPEMAIDALFIDSVKNTWLPNGHNYQRPNLPLYLPGNGGLLAAVALMAAGWEGGPELNAPGFPKEWVVQWEDLQPLL